MKELIKLQLIASFNKSVYVYSPIVKSENKYYRCKSIKRERPTKTKDIDANILVLSTEINSQYYAANNLPPI